jgi:hypothetical protein
MPLPKNASVLKHYKKRTFFLERFTRGKIDDFRGAGTLFGNDTSHYTTILNQGIETSRMSSFYSDLSVSILCNLLYHLLMPIQTL